MMKRTLTLIETIIVVIIVAILALVAIPRIISFKLEARAARDHAILAALRSAVHLYYVQSARSGEPYFPPDLDTLQSIIHWSPLELIDEYEWEIILP